MVSADTGAKYVLAVDLGTSGPKVGLVTTDGEILGHEFEPTALLLLPGGGAEQDPDDWWRAICQAARRLLSRHPIPVENIVAVNCMAQWGGTIAVGRDGRHLMNAIIWLDARGAPYAQRLVGGLVTISGYEPLKLAQWIRIVGLAPARSGKDPAGHILFIRHERPEVYHETYKFLEPLDYLNLRLTGCFSASYDSIGTYFATDNRKVAHIRYHESLLRMLDLPRDKLPDLLPTASVLGQITPVAAAELGLSERTQVVTGTPDLHSAAIGSGAVRDYEPHLYLGTSAWVLCHVPFKKTDPLHAIGTLPAGIPGRYLAGGVQETGGACLTFLRDKLLYVDDELATAAPAEKTYTVLDRVAGHAQAGSGGVIFTPWLYGERTPVDDSTVRGGFHNLSLTTERSHLVRAVFEGVALNTRWGFQYVERFMNRRLDGINAVGGGARSAVWCQIIADVFDRTVRQVQEPQLCNVRGAALQAAAALGYVPFNDIGARVPIAATYRPDPAVRRLYDELFREFVNLYRQNRGIYARLNRVSGRRP